MEADHRTAILSRIVPVDAADIDEIIAEFDQRSASTGRDVFAASDATPIPATAMKRKAAVSVGFRATARLADAADRAMRLAAFAIERDVEIIVLAEIDNCGLEQFGFRIERIAGETPAQRADCEAQIRRFWNIDLVL